MQTENEEFERDPGRFEYAPSGPTIARFHASTADVRIAMGPLGSGKTTACCYEILRRCLEQAPSRDKVRRSRWLVCRQTVPELETTTLPSWRQHFGVGLGPWKMSVPITHAWRFEVGDGTKVEADIYFMGLDGEDAVNKIRGMELTGAWINECKDVPKSVLDMLTGRVARYPSRAMGGQTWTGIIADTNMPDDDHWLYTLAEVSQPKGWEFFRQPGGVIKLGDEWVLNPAAENLQHLRDGYYERQVGGKADEWIRVFLGAEYGYVSDGRPVYPEYSDVHHVAEFDYVPGVDLLVGCDFGLVPAAVFAQQDAWGRLWVIDELLPEDIGAKQFAIEIKRFIASKYGTKVTVGDAYGDPIGEKRQQGNEDILTTFQIMAANGFKCKPAPGNNEFVLRREAVVGMLTRFVDGRPGLIFNRRCVRLRAGMSGKYCFKRVQQKGDVFADKPNKNTGHADICFVAGTMIDTPVGRVPVERLRCGDLVSTPLGPRAITDNWSRSATVLDVNIDGMITTCTPDHPFWTQRGWIDACELKLSDLLTRRGQKTGEWHWFVRSWLPATVGRSIRFLNSMASGFAGRLTTGMQWSMESPSLFTGRFTRPITVQFQMESPFITSTMTGAIITQKISLRSALQSIRLITTRIGRKSKEAAERKFLSLGLSRLPLNGVGRIRSLPDKLVSKLRQNSGAANPSKRFIASGVEGRIRRSNLPERRVSVQCLVRVWQESKVALMTKLENASSAVLSFARTVTLKRKPARAIVGKKRYEERVYGITVDSAHCYYANGVLVSNCESLQYLCLGLGEGRTVIKGRAGKAPEKPKVQTGTKFSHHTVGRSRRPPRYGARK